MNLFDQTVAEALRNQQGLSVLRPVVEKELLHHDILREMGRFGLLSSLVFIGGTCLRACYGSRRLSEDLDFAGGADFSKDWLAGFGEVLTESLGAKYGLPVAVSEPTREEGNVDTWKIRIQTRPDRRDLPAQRIHLDICAIPSHDARPMLLRNPYGVEMGTSGLIVRAASREEILADKLLAFALRPGRIKNRDLWDIAWLRQQGISLPHPLLPAKITDHHQTLDSFLLRLNERRIQLATETGLEKEFQNEMRRFLPLALIDSSVTKPEFWIYLVSEIDAACTAAERALKMPERSSGFPM